MIGFQVVNFKVLEGIAKASQRPYKMMAVSGIVTNEDGSMEVGEVVFMDRQGFPLPTHLKPGQKYEAVCAARARDGKITFEIAELKPLAAAVAKAA